MIFHENCLHAYNSHEMSYLIFFRKFGKMLQNLSSAAIVIDALRVKKEAISQVLQERDMLCRGMRSTLAQLWNDRLEVEGSLVGDSLVLCP